jgi:DNA-directed RNA polymerase sigma subunit (sigma70/sigma32)
MKKKYIKAARLQHEFSDAEKRVIAERLGFKTRPLSREMVCDMFAISLDRLLEVEDKAKDLLENEPMPETQRTPGDLSNYEKRVVKARIGLYGKPKSRKEVCEKFEMPEDRLRQVEENVKKLLRSLSSGLCK